MSESKSESSPGYGGMYALRGSVQRPGTSDTAGYWIKPIFDTAFSALALVFFSPFLLLIAIVIAVSSRGPVFIVQERIGRDGKPFGCLKFRTMVVDADQRLDQLLAECPKARQQWHETRKLNPDPRITRVGKFLRKTSLDELPQFFNVLRGDMSVVGPRPIVADEIERYADRFRYYKAVKPGISGLWQVSGRSDTSYASRVEMDVRYVLGMSLKLDLSIIAKTVGVVMFGRGAY